MKNESGREKLASEGWRSERHILVDGVSLLGCLGFPPWQAVLNKGGYIASSGFTALCFAFDRPVTRAGNLTKSDPSCDVWSMAFCCG